MNKLKISFYSDPGHGWAAVKRQLLDELGISEYISEYSFQKGKTVYLEEDQDLPTFLDAFSKQRKQKVELVEMHTDRRSPIRSYEPYSE
jgi:hypothetical protein